MGPAHPVFIFHFSFAFRIRHVFCGLRDAAAAVLSGRRAGLLRRVGEYQSKGQMTFRLDCRRKTRAPMLCRRVSARNRWGGSGTVGASVGRAASGVCSRWLPADGGGSPGRAVPIPLKAEFIVQVCICSTSCCGPTFTDVRVCRQSHPAEEPLDEFVRTSPKPALISTVRSPPGGWGKRLAAHGRRPT